jgi:hypothetical protein
MITFNPLNAQINPICHLLALLGAHHILHVNRIRVKKCRGYSQGKKGLARKWPEPVEGIPLHFLNIAILHLSAYEDGTDSVFRNVGI